MGWGTALVRPTSQSLSTNRMTFKRIGMFQFTQRSGLTGWTLELYIKGARKSSHLKWAACGYNRKKKDAEKALKYGPLGWELKQQFACYEVQQNKIVMDALVGRSWELKVTAIREIVGNNAETYCDMYRRRIQYSRAHLTWLPGLSMLVARQENSSITVRANVAEKSLFQGSPILSKGSFPNMLPFGDT